MLTFAASGLTLAAVATVYKSWRAQTSPMLYAGLVLWLVATICWSFAQGWEFGVLYALCIPSLIVWPFIALNQTQLPAPQNSPAPRKFDFSRKTVVGNAVNYFVILVFLLVVSVLSTLGFCALLPFSMAGKLGAGIVLLPIFWGLMVYHYLVTQRKFFVLGAYGVLASVSVPILLLLPM